MKRILMYMSIMVVNILSAQEQIEISGLILGDSIITIIDVHKTLICDLCLGQKQI